MNTMTHALKDAGFAVPANKRVWLWLKDHPNKTATEIARALHLGRKSDAPNIMKDLLSRGMVSVTVVPRAPNIRRGPARVNSYAALGAEFELLPKRKAPPAVVAKHVASTPVPPPEPKVEKPVGTFAINVENMTLRDAKAVYLQLKAIFE